MIFQECSVNDCEEPLYLFMVVKSLVLSVIKESFNDGILPSGNQVVSPIE